MLVYSNLACEGDLWLLPSSSEGLLRRHDYCSRDRLPASIPGVVIVARKLVAGAHWELGGRLGPTDVMGHITCCCGCKRPILNTE